MSVAKLTDRIPFTVVASVLLTAGILSSTARATTYIIHPDQSDIRHSGYLWGFAPWYIIQSSVGTTGPGGFWVAGPPKTAHYAGTLNADMQTGSVQFTGGSLIDAIVDAGTGADYYQDLTGRASGQPIYSGKFVAKDIVADIISPSLPLDASNFAFSASSTMLSFLPGSWINSFNTDLAGQSMGITGTGNVTKIDEFEVLTLSFSGSLNIDYPPFYGVSLSFNGQIVATNGVAEPSASALSLLSVPALFALRRRLS